MRREIFNFQTYFVEIYGYDYGFVCKLKIGH